MVLARTFVIANAYETVPLTAPNAPGLDGWTVRPIALENSQAMTATGTS